MKMQTTLSHPRPSSAEYLERALYILQDAILILNRHAQIIYINRAAEMTLKRELRQMPALGDNYLDFVHQDRQQITSQLIDDALCNQPSSLLARFGTPEKETWYELAYHPMPDETGIVTHVCVRILDVSEKILLQKKLESEREKQKNRLIKAVVDAQERQRSEIGRELHDNVNQVLTTIKLYNEICLTEEQTNKNLLLRSVQQINYCIETLRVLSRTLSSPKIEETDLKDSIKELVDEINATRKITAKFFTYGIEKEKVSQDLQTTLYRIAQEQLTNVLKYAKAAVVDVLLVGTANSVALKIQDDGVGFDPKQKRTGVGVTNMISRAETLGGTIEIVSEPGKGCSLMAEFPLA